MSAERGFVPINKVESDRLRLDLNLPPFINEGTVGVNLRRVESLCQFSGITFVHVLGTVDDETTSSSVPMIVGVNKHGEAIAGRARSKTNVSEHKVFGTNRTQKLDYSTRSIEIRLNISEISNVISQDRKAVDGVHSNQAWATHIDRALRDGIRKEGTQNLAHGAEHLLALPINLAYPPLFIYEIATQSLGALVITSAFYTYGKVANLMDSRVRGEIKNYRLSAFYDCQLDRVVILNARMLRGKLVKPIPDK